MYRGGASLPRTSHSQRVGPHSPNHPPEVVYACHTICVQIYSPVVTVSLSKSGEFTFQVKRLPGIDAGSALCPEWLISTLVFFLRDYFFWLQTQKVVGFNWPSVDAIPEFAG